MPEASASAVLTEAQLSAVRRRTIGVLSIGQVLGGVAFGATISLGAVLATDIAGDEAVAGFATAAVTLGAAALAIPLARLAQRRGRRLSLATGMLIALGGVALVISAAAMRSFPALLVGFALIGAGQAANLQSRFAASDLATDASRGRDLSLVVWATTIGAVLGPNLVGPGESIGASLGMPQLTGAYVFTIVCQVLGVVLYLVALRPDPLLLAQKVAADDAASGTARIARADRPRAARYAIFAVAGAHGVMVAVMAMTPVHLLHHGATLMIVGLTISLHIAGMYALAPVFGFLADRVGRITVILIGQVLLAAALLTAGLGQDSTAAVTIGLVLLGLGWSASTVAGSALLTEMSSEDRRTSRQGRSDLAMNLVGAIGAILAGVVLGAIGYGGLALIALVVVAAVSALSPFASRVAAR
ncbi:MFS family permease [Microbacterium halimionae]|uniref:MFS family permease n=1 Tax=Microbacterium halimionae TaxID=1526413 RepID=A0A7W3PMY0_9MICO|nr:MFS transporter [Microbacterium halimionae]MBA8817409.1 MFS family permease [Microbacterium halimionae]NII96043.1 MFS family permease [Microbacterium halimionae]